MQKRSYLTVLSPAIMKIMTYISFSFSFGVKPVKPELCLLKELFHGYMISRINSFLLTYIHICFKDI